MTEQRGAPDSEDRRRKAVRDRYAAVAEAVGRGGADPSAQPDGDAGCCTGCCGDEGGGSDAHGLGRAVGYDDDDLGSVPEGANLGLGCGNPVGLASLSSGEVVVDLGSGAGFDCFLAADRVGPEGRVIGVDMTPAMIDRARENAGRHGHENVEFRLGEIEALPVADGVADLVMSNCVLNLSSDRARALSEAYRVLRPGGRIVISDLVSDRPAPAALADDLDAVAACLPVTREAYLASLREAGFQDVRIEEEHDYPAEALLHEDGVRAHLDDHPDDRADLEAFAREIRGAVMVGVRTA